MADDRKRLVQQGHTVASHLESELSPDTARLRKSGPRIRSHLLRLRRCRASRGDRALVSYSNAAQGWPEWLLQGMDRRETGVRQWSLPRQNSGGHGDREFQNLVRRRQSRRKQQLRAYGQYPYLEWERSIGRNRGPGPHAAGGLWAARLPRPGRGLCQKMTLECLRQRVCKNRQRRLFRWVTHLPRWTRTGGTIMRARGIIMVLLTL